VVDFLQRDALQFFPVFFLPEAGASGLPPKSGLAESLGRQAEVEKAPPRGTATEQASGFDALSFCSVFLTVLSWDRSLQLTSQPPPMARLHESASDLRRRDKQRNCLARKELRVSTRSLLQCLGKVIPLVKCI